jgi:hypothetical protein
MVVPQSCEEAQAKSDVRAWMRGKQFYQSLGGVRL